MGIDGLVDTVQDSAAFHDGDLSIGFDFPNGIHPIEADHNRILRLGRSGQAGVASNRNHRDILGKTGARNRAHVGVSDGEG